MWLAWTSSHYGSLKVVRPRASLTWEPGENCKGFFWCGLRSHSVVSTTIYWCTQGQPIFKREKAIQGHEYQESWFIVGTIFKDYLPQGGASYGRGRPKAARVGQLNSSFWLKIELDFFRNVVIHWLHNHSLSPATLMMTQSQPALESPTFRNISAFFL